MTFRQFAWKNVTRNAQGYVAYFLCSTFSVAIFFSYAIFMFHPVLVQDQLGGAVKAGMTAAEYIIFFFSFFFVLYSVGSFLKVRQKEFGILTIIGAEESQIYRIVFMENLTIGALSIGSGLAIGLLFSKLFLLLSSEMTGFKHLDFYFPVKAISLTLGAFAALFILISFITPFFLRKKETIDLLKGSSKPKPEPKASILLSLFSALCIGSAFVLTQFNLGQTYIYILALGTIGVYFFFTQLSVYMIRLFKRKQPFFYRGVNLLWLSEMAYKVKDSARIFFIITVVTAMACGFISIVLSGDSQNKREFTHNPFAIQYTSYNTLEPGWDQDIKTIDQVLAENRIHFKKIQYVSESVNFMEEPSYPITVISLSVYQQLQRGYDLPKIHSLGEQKAVVVQNSLYKPENEKRKTDDQPLSKLTYKPFSFDVIRQETVKIPNDYTECYLVIADQQFNKLNQDLKKREDVLHISKVFYSIPEWSNKEFPKKNSDELSITNKIKSQITKESGMILLRAQDYLELKQTYSIVKFVWIFIAAIFSVASVSFLYFKLYSDLQTDQERYQSLSRIGLSEQEMSKSASIQIAILFFLPLLIAALGSIITVELIGPKFHYDTTIPSSLLTVSGYTIVQIVFFLVIRALYVKKLTKAML